MLDRATGYSLETDYVAAERELAEERWLREAEETIRKILDEHGSIFVSRIVRAWETERAGSPFGCPNTEGEPRLERDQDGLRTVAI